MSVSEISKTAWKVLIDNKIEQFPVRPTGIARKNNILVFEYSDYMQTPNRGTRLAGHARNSSTVTGRTDSPSCLMEDTRYFIIIATAPHVAAGRLPMSWVISSSGTSQSNAQRCPGAL